jgi:hypothetical protein
LYNAGGWWFHRRPGAHHPELRDHAHNGVGRDGFVTIFYIINK